MLNSTLIERIDVARGLFILKIQPDFNIPDFVPGQYVALGLPKSDVASDGEKRQKLIKRAYSVASAPNQKEHLEFYLAIVENGELTPRLHHMCVGERLFVSPKFVGTFTLSSLVEGKDMVFVSTGTGIAPYISMLRAGEVFTMAPSITLLHGVRYETDLAYSKELRGYESLHSNFRYIATISRAGEHWHGNRGYVGRFLLDETVPVSVENTHVFMCGNPAMIDENEDFLIKKGFSVYSKRNPTGNIHHEKYW